MKNNSFKDVRAYLREYCIHSSVHGFQYFGEKKRSVFEKIWWFIVFTTCLSVLSVSIYAVYNKWSRSPVIVNFANRGTPIYKIPFPAVTICPDSKSSQKIFNFTEVMQKKEDNITLSTLEEKRFEYMSLICNYYPHINYTKNDTFSEDFYRTIDEIKPTFTVQNCSLLDKAIACDKVFFPVITDQGVCYTFNMIDRNLIFKDNVVHYADFHKIHPNSTQWHLQDGYSNDAGLEPYPYRAHLSGAVNGFIFNIVTFDEDLDYACKDSLQGYKVLLHTPMTIPRPSQKYFRIPLDQSVVGSVHPVMITTSETVKMFHPEKRKCYFAEERYLRYFLKYTSSNCKLECLANYTLRKCGCVNFYMPRNITTKICGTSMIPCMKTAEGKTTMVFSHLATELEKQPSTLVRSTNLGCNCLPVCSDLTYEVETSQTDWKWKQWLRARRNLPQLNNTSHMSSLTLFFESDTFIASERNELYGPIDFLANFGGLLGLFTGFSVLSLMEIVYFLTVRIICNLKLHGKWVGVTE